MDAVTTEESLLAFQEYEETLKLKEKIGEDSLFAKAFGGSILLRFVSLTLFHAAIVRQYFCKEISYVVKKRWLTRELSQVCIFLRFKRELLALYLFIYCKQ